MSNAISLANKISDVDYNRICKLLYQVIGIHLGEKKQTLVESRLNKRLVELKFQDFKQYVDYLEKHLEQEAPFLIEAMTTHKTEWFREYVHFDFLKKEIVKQKNRPLMIWSAACSTGEEVWSLAMTLQSLGFTPNDYRLLGTDISLDVIQKCEKAQYPTSGMMAPPQTDLTKKYLYLNKEVNPPVLQVSDELRSVAKFRKQNLIDLNLPKDIKFDFIFLRNVLIYFDPASTKKVIEGLVPYMKPDSYLVIGLSESLRELPPELENIGHSIYKKGSIK